MAVNPRLLATIWLGVCQSNLKHNLEFDLKSN